MILITGAAGKTGRAIITALAQRDVRVRALVRRPVQAPVARAAGAGDVLVGDIEHAQWQKQAKTTGLSDYAIATLLRMFTYYERFGLVGNPNILGWLLERPPVSLPEFVAREFCRAQ